MDRHMVLWTKHNDGLQWTNGTERLRAHQSSRSQALQGSEIHRGLRKGQGR
jgi:hypothetical protein